MNARCVRIALLLAMVAFPGRLMAETTVTTYVVKVQEEREKTRWTLTEWLRIKERMKMMDVWLAMFSDPKKDTFRPELNLVYGMTRGDLKLTDAAGASEKAELSGAQGRAQLWLTNILTGTVGIRTLNIDLGMEGSLRKSGEFTPAKGAQAALAADSTDAATDAAATSRTLKHSYYTGNLRIFGKSIQDSSLILKYGQYNSTNTVPSWTDPTASAKERRGIVAGGEAQFYVLRFLGVEGNYLSYGDKASAAGSDEVKGRYYDYMAYLEISLLRFMVGKYGEDWTFDNGGNKVRSTEQGMIGGVKVQL